MRLDDAKEEIESQSIPWDELREQRVLAGLRHARSGRALNLGIVRHPLAAATAVAACFVAAVLGLGLSNRPHAPAQPATVPSAVAQALPVVVRPPMAPPETVELRVLAGLGRISLRQGAKLTLALQRTERVVLQQQGGIATYNIDHRDGREVLVRAAEVTVRVVGTEFDVAVEPEAVRVAVTRGIVRVAYGQRDVELVAGEELVVHRLSPSLGGTEVDTAPAEPVITSRPNATATAADSPPAVATVEAVEAVSPPTKAAQIGALLEDADAARKAGDPERAASQLRAALALSDGDPRRAALCFTLGNVESGRRRFAAGADAYKAALAAAPEGPLAEDALAAMAEANAKDGRIAEAGAAAARYLERYPAGVHLQSMQKLAPR